HVDVEVQAGEEPVALLGDGHLGPAADIGEHLRFQVEVAAERSFQQVHVPAEQVEVLLRGELEFQRFDAAQSIGEIEVDVFRADAYVRVLQSGAANAHAAAEAQRSAVQGAGQVCDFQSLAGEVEPHVQIAGLQGRCFHGKLAAAHRHESLYVRLLGRPRNRCLYLGCATDLNAFDQRRRQSGVGVAAELQIERARTGQ